VRWECGNPAFFAGFPRTVGSEGNGFMFSSLSIRPSFPPRQKGDFWTRNHSEGSFTLGWMKDTFSLVVLPLLLELIPLALTLLSWWFGRGALSHLSRLRVASFRTGLLLSGISLLVIASCWINPTMRWLGAAWLLAFTGSIGSLLLALLGKGWPRVLLAISALLSILLAYGSLLQNGV
jgi:hypothetical protein